MSNTIGTIKDLDASKKEALQGLLGSLGQANNHPSSDAESSAKQLQKLSEKINEILGDQPGQLLNEDGLPIVDISEPVSEDPQTSTSTPPIQEQELISFSFLPPDEKERRRRRRDRDRILDLLEEEERLQQLQDERDAEEERKEAVRKRKESVKAELEQLKAARELQRKMGQALVRREKGMDNGRENGTRSEPQVTSPVVKKSVSFADTPAIETDKGTRWSSICQPGWGHVTPSRLRAQNRIPLVSADEAQKYPMKMHVVERRPLADSAFPFNSHADSDDESSPDYPSPHAEMDSSDGSDRTSSGDDDPLDDEPLDEGFDYDAAQHHREIALEYHKKRHAIGVETAKAMTAHTLDDGRHETSNEQPPFSPVRAERMAAMYNQSLGPVSTPAGQFVLPSHQEPLQNSVRLGKLENDQLVGGYSSESGSEEGTTREIIHMLQTGKFQNIGPDFKPSSMSAMASHPNSDAVGPTTVGTSTAAHGAKPSRFKLARGGRITPSATFDDNNGRDHDSPPQTISSVVERKVPKSFSGQRFPVNRPSIPRPLVKASEPAPSTIHHSL